MAVCRFVRGVRSLRESDLVYWEEGRYDNCNILLEYSMIRYSRWLKVGWLGFSLS